jgi:L-ascorbate metabolism protein UlaG (beta-lactamase superfamily)
VRLTALALATLLPPLLAAPGGAALASGCFPVASTEPRVHLAAADLPAGATVRLTFLGHASFLIETAGGVRAVTDYNGYVGAPVTPEVVTMNNAHSTHYAFDVDPGVRHVLRGWNPAGGEARHDVTERDMRVRNVPTSVHGRSGAQGNSNSIFVFEVADLCVAHLGHLHHLLTKEHLAELGQIDVLLVPVDGTWTMSHAEMVEVIERVGAPLVIPMHYFGTATLGRFLRLVEGRYEVVVSEGPSVDLSRAALPTGRRVLVLPGG